MCIPHQYELLLQGRNALPPWHSRRVKQEAREAGMSCLGSNAAQHGRAAAAAAAASRQWVSRVCR